MTDLAVIVVGDHQPANETHLATDLALRHSAADLGLGVEIIWMATDTIDANTAGHLAGVDAMFIAPGSPYRSMDGAIAAIATARTEHVPLLGTCGGMQHIVLELARNVIGAADAGHAEVDPGGDDLWVTPLACSLAGQTGPVHLVPETVAADAYQTDEATEAYYCRFGISTDRVDQLVAAGLVVAGTDDVGEARIVERPDHPFFVGTLFVPQARSRHDAPHPLVTALLAAAARR